MDVLEAAKVILEFETTPYRDMPIDQFSGEHRIDKHLVMAQDFFSVTFLHELSADYIRSILWMLKAEKEQKLVDKKAQKEAKLEEKKAEKKEKKRNKAKKKLNDAKKALQNAKEDLTKDDIKNAKFKVKIA